MHLYDSPLLSTYISSLDTMASTLTRLLFLLVTVVVGLSLSWCPVLPATAATSTDVDVDFDVDSAFKAAAAAAAVTSTYGVPSLDKLDNVTEEEQKVTGSIASASGTAAPSSAGTGGGGGSGSNDANLKANAAADLDLGLRLEQQEDEVEVQGSRWRRAMQEFAGFVRISGRRGYCGRSSALCSKKKPDCCNRYCTNIKTDKYNCGKCGRYVFHKLV